MRSDLTKTYLTFRVAQKVPIFHQDKPINLNKKMEVFMKIKHFLVTLLMVMVLGVFFLNAVSYMAVEIDPTNPLKINVGAIANGVYRSTDGGLNWSPYNNGLTNPNVTALAIRTNDPANMMAGTVSGDVFFTSSGGIIWAPGGTGLPPVTAIRDFEIYPYNHYVVYAGDTAIGGVYKTYDGGANWSLTSPLWNVYAVAVNPGAPNVVFAGTGTGVYKSMDHAVNWSPVMPPAFEVRALAIDPNNTNIIFAGGRIGNTAKVFRNENTGGAIYWEEVYSETIYVDHEAVGFVTSIEINPDDSSHIIFGTYGGGVYKSVNNGDSGSWFQVNTGLTTLIVYDLAIDGTSPSKNFAATYNGVFRTTNGGASWTQVL